MLLSVPCGGPDLSVLNRREVPNEDALLQYYIDQYRSRLTWQPPSAPAATRVRADAFDDYAAMTGQFFSRGQIVQTLQGYSPTGTTPSIIDGAEPAGCIVSHGSRCGSDVRQDATRQALNFAAYLLNQPDTNYVCVVDLGLEPAQGGGDAGYDTHGANAQTVYRNLTSTLELVAKLTDPTQPGGPRLDPFTMIVLTTEFGRTPQPEGLDGRNHYPYAYVNVLIPPPNQVKPRPARRILGGIDQDARVVKFPGSDLAAITPTDLRGALLVALGMDPFAQGLFGVGDFSENIAQGSEDAARDNLVRRVLGYNV
jgi:hypothetical protein